MVPDSSPARWKPAQSFALVEEVGIAADPNRRDPGGKGKFSVAGESVMTRGAALSHSGARKTGRPAP